MKHANIHEAKTHFSALIKRVQSGDEVVIAKDGTPVAKLVKIKPASKKRELGYDEGLPYRMASDFDSFIPDGFTEYEK